MRALYIITLSLFASWNLAFAQCNDCNTPAGFSPDYCHKSKLFAEHCAQFSDKADFFYLKSKKQPVKLQVPETGDVAYLLSLAKDKTLKLTATDILFIQDALAAWSVERVKVGYTFTESGLGIKILKEGTGELPLSGQTVTVHYKGTLENGTQFDSSFDRGKPIEFPLGTGRVIKGWDEGIARLKIGTRAMLRIPAELGYGSRDNGVIPPNSTLYFLVEVLGAN